MVTKQKNVLLRNIGCRKSSLEVASVQCLLERVIAQCPFTKTLIWLQKSTKRLPSFFTICHWKGKSVRASTKAAPMGG